MAEKNFIFVIAGVCILALVSLSAAGMTVAMPIGTGGTQSRSDVEPDGTPVVVADIERASQAGDYERARKLGNAVIESGGPTQFSAWQRRTIIGFAYYRRYFDRVALGDERSTALADLVTAARLGYLPAIRMIDRMLRAKLDGDDPSGTFTVSDADITDVLRTGAGQGDLGSLLLLASGKTFDNNEVPLVLEPGERIYWSMLFQFKLARRSGDDPRTAVEDIRKMTGQEDLESILSRYAWSYSSNPPIATIPGRSASVLMWADMDLKNALGTAFHILTYDGKEKPNTKDVWTFFEEYGNHIEREGLGRLFLLTPFPNAKKNPDIRTLPAAQIVRGLLPADRLFVRCGPLSHVSVVFKVELETNQLWLSDPFYRYWESANNPCSTKMRIADGPAGSALTIVDLDEVAESLVAVGTVRDGSQAGTGGAP